MNNTFTNYKNDILGSGYEQLTLNFPDDYEGKVIATLVRKKSSLKTSKAILHIHGFIDYFFHKEMAEQFNQHGYDFYALDLRKYGRSILPHQKPYYVLNLKEYDAEITQALKIIGDEGHSSIVLSGHSTGGLTVTLYAARHKDNQNIKALWLNSPFYDFNMGKLQKKFLLPRISKLGQKFNTLKIPSGMNKWYSYSLHKSLKGEWEFNLDWKPKFYTKLYISFIHAIHEAHKELHNGLRFNIPVLVMHSDKTKNPKNYNHEVETSDVVLDVKTIEKYANKLQGDVNVITIKDGLHDLVLSAPNVRAEVYRQLFSFLKAKNIE
jgi:alpha-beta hydrolase superfamily lysophospholipase